jgi:hypothetical protein
MRDSSLKRQSQLHTVLLLELERPGLLHRQKEVLFRALCFVSVQVVDED